MERFVDLLAALFVAGPHLTFCPPLLKLRLVQATGPLVGTYHWTFHCFMAKLQDRINVRPK